MLTRYRQRKEAFVHVGLQRDKPTYKILEIVNKQGKERLAEKTPLPRSPSCFKTFRDSISTPNH